MQIKHSLIAVLFLTIKLAPLQGQMLNCEKQLITTAWKNTGKVISAPIRYDYKDWTLVGLGLSATALAFTYDSKWQAQLIAGGTTFKSNLATYVGEPFGNPIYVGGFLALNYAVACRTNQQKWTQLSAEALQSMVIASGITLVLKASFHRHRPEEQSQLNPYVFDGPAFSRSNMSFPSGHTTVAFALASSVSAFYDNKWYVAAPAFTLASISGWSRIYQQKHWPSDVVLGALIGTTVGYTIHNLSGGEDKKMSFIVSPNFMGGASLNVSYKLD